MTGATTHPKLSIFARDMHELEKNFTLLENLLAI